MEHDLSAVAFPTLDETQMAALGRLHPAMLRVNDGTRLFEARARDIKSFVVKTGAIEILDEAGDPPRTVTMYKAGQFTGDVTQLTGSPSFFSGVARGECEVYVFSPEALRNILNDLPDVGYIILQAFIGRRQLLKESKTFRGGTRDWIAIFPGYLSGSGFP